jgi:hypothetical protein
MIIPVPSFANLMTASMSCREQAAQPAGIAGLSVHDFKPTDFKSVVVG